MRREKLSGIYVIVNTATGDFYLGSSVDIHGRWCGHRQALRRGEHANSRMQRSWRKYGETGYAFVIVALVPVDELAPTETRLLRNLVGRRDCYNVALSAEAPMRGRRHSAVTRRRMSRAQSSREMSAEAKALASERMRAANAAGLVGGATLRGLRRTEEQCRAMSAARKGRRLSPETRARIGEKSRGRRHTAASKAKIAAARRGKHLSAEHRERTRLALVGRKQSPETIAKRVAKNRGQKRSPEQIARIVAGRGPMTPDQREAVAAAQRGRNLSAERRQHLRMVNLGKKQSPETIAKRVASIAATRERKRLARDANQEDLGL